MQIQLLDSWFREYVTTKATPTQIGEYLSLTSVSVERIEKHGKDFIYDIEVTTNRPDLMSVIGLAREMAAILPQFGISATLKQPQVKEPKEPVTKTVPFTVKNDPKLVNRVCAVVMEVTQKDSPRMIKERLETSGIRSLNNLVDITNYVMREIGHPTHVFDYDRLSTKTLVIREAKKGEQITTLDHKTHTLLGGDIIAENGEGEIEDLLGVMGTANSVITNDTKRIVFFIDNLDATHIRKTSMSLAIRSEAAVLNEKGIDSELAYKALLRGIALYKELADGVVISNIMDIYPNKPTVPTISISEDKIASVIGVSIPIEKAARMLEPLGFDVTLKQSTIDAVVPSWRRSDVMIAEDLIEEIARIYGYHQLPSILPPTTAIHPYHPLTSPFYWEERVKETLKYWGFTETYTYSMVSQDLYEGPTDDAVTIQNPLTEDMVYLRKTLVPSLLQVVRENKKREDIHIFEVANVYHKKVNDLPDELRMVAGVIQKKQVSFYEVKGIIEQLLADVGIAKTTWKQRKSGGVGADVFIGKEYLGEVEILEDNLIDFELSLAVMLSHATNKKIYKPIAKFPPIIEDLTLVVDETIATEEIIETMKQQSSLITNVSLLDQYQNNRTFHIIYQHQDKNLSSEDVSPIRAKIIMLVKNKFDAQVK